MQRIKSPFALAFIIGIVVLTAMPFLQRQFLKAPAPLGPFGPWSLTEFGDAGTVTDRALGGHVLLATFAPNPCDAPCQARNAALGRSLQHTDDLQDAVHLLTVVAPGADPAIDGGSQPRWHVLTGTTEQLEPFFTQVRSAWAAFAGTDAGTTVTELSALPAYMVVDGAGHIRGFWRDDSAGRGNAINAARLLAKQKL